MKIDHILKLARLEVAKEEKKALEKDFAAILGFVKKLEKLDVSKIKELNYQKTTYNKLREDKARPKKEISEKLIKAAPSQEKKYFKVKEVLS